MKQRLMMTIFGVIITLISCGCGSTHRTVTEIVYDAKGQIAAAKEANAQNLAPQELADAERMLTRSEETLSAGKETEAYRLGMRAHLKAKIAEAIAIANQREAAAGDAEGALELKLQAVAAAHRDLEQVGKELEELRLTPEE